MGGAWAGAWLAVASRAARRQIETRNFDCNGRFILVRTFLARNDSRSYKR
jgi:hypothetical protein